MQIKRHSQEAERTEDEWSSRDEIPGIVEFSTAMTVSLPGMEGSKFS